MHYAYGRPTSYHTLLWVVFFTISGLFPNFQAVTLAIAQTTGQQGSTGQQPSSQSNVAAIAPFIADFGVFLVLGALAILVLTLCGVTFGIRSLLSSYAKEQKSFTAAKKKTKSLYRTKLKTSDTVDKCGLWSL